MSAWLKRASRYLLYGIFAALAVASAAEIWLLQQKGGSPQTDPIHILDAVEMTVGGQTREVSLPVCVQDQAPGTEIVIRAKTPLSVGDALYVKTVYAPLSVYVDGTLLGELGKMDAYPSWMRDPATEVQYLTILSDPEKENDSDIRLVYRFPYQKDSLMIYPIAAGEIHALNAYLWKWYGALFLLSVVYIGYGIAVTCIFVTGRRHINGIRMLFWSGVFITVLGLWIIGECNLTNIFLNQPMLLYFTAFMALQCSAVPFLKVSRYAVLFHDTKWLDILDLAAIAYPCALTVLQVTGIVSFYHLISLTQAFLLAAFSAVMGMTLREWFRYRSRPARRYLVVLVILAFSIFLELFNYHSHFLFQSAAYFSVGMFALFIAYYYCGVLYLKDLYLTIHREDELKQQVKLMKIQQKEQNLQLELIRKQEADARRTRHDIRHQLMAIRGIACSEKASGVTQYIDQLLRLVPTGIDIYCDNISVNSIVSYIHRRCAEDHIQMDVRLTVPEHMRGVSDSELCAVFGNLLENAFEACSRQKTGSRFIRIASMVRDDMLIISMDNSYGEKIRRVNGEYISSKRDDVGTGLSSIASVAESHGGSASFEADESENIFHSSVYLRETTRQTARMNHTDNRGTGEDDG